MRFILLKNKGGKYFQTETYSLSDYVNSLSRFLSISPKDFMDKIHFPDEIKYVSEKPYEWFDVTILDLKDKCDSMDKSDSGHISISNTVDTIINAFSANFKRLVHENNHRMPLSYRMMDFFSKNDYGQKKAIEKINDLATLRFWRIGN